MLSFKHFYDFCIVVANSDVVGIVSDITMSLSESVSYSNQTVSAQPQTDQTVQFLTHSQSQWH